jgi:hypothetical protein
VALATDGTVWGVGTTGNPDDCAPSATPSTQGGVALIAAYSQNGDARGVWKLPVGQSATGAYAIATGASGSVYVGGDVSGVVDLDPGPGVAARWAGKYPGGFILKLAPDASFLWGQTLPDTPISALAGTADGGVLAAGGGTGSLMSGTVIKLGPDGRPGWTFAIDGPASPTTIAARGTSFAVAGGMSPPASVDYDPGPGMDVLDGDTFVSRFSF